MILTPELWHWTSPIWWAVGLVLVLYFLAFRRVETGPVGCPVIGIGIHDDGLCLADWILGRWLCF